MKLLELFKGTGSIGKVFEEAGWEVVSLDVDPKSAATITADILNWDYKQYEPGSFDVIWGSPPCTEYSRAKTRGVRRLEYADQIVQRLLDIIEYFKPAVWWFENPHSGLLRHRSVVAHLPIPFMVSYCMYGAPYRKNTALWSNVTNFTPKTCDKMCGSYVNGKHASRAQRGEYSVNELYMIPPSLCEAILLATKDDL